MLYCAVLNHSPGIRCGILNLIVQSLFLLKLCSHCPGLAPQFAGGKSNQGKPGQTVMNRDRTLVLPWQTGKNQDKPGSLRGCIKMFNTTGVNPGEL